MQTSRRRAVGRGARGQLRNAACVCQAAIRSQMRGGDAKAGRGA